MGKKKREKGQKQPSLCCAWQLLLDLFCSLSLLIRTWDHNVRLMKVRGTPCGQSCVSVCGRLSCSGLTRATGSCHPQSESTYAMWPLTDQVCVYRL